MSANPAVKAKLTKQAFSAVLYAGAIATVAAVSVSAAEVPGLETVAQQVLQVGAPAMIGTAVAGILSNPFATGNRSPTDYIMRGLVAGTTASIVLMTAGALPVALDTQTMGFVLLVGASAVGAEFIANAVEI